MGKYLEGIQTAIVIIAALITLYFQATGDRSVQSIAFFSLLIILIILYFAYSYVKDKFGQIEAMASRLKTLENKVDYMKDLQALKTQVAVLEEKVKHKKGQIDPRIIIIVFIIIVLLLYLRSIRII